MEDLRKYSSMHLRKEQIRARTASAKALRWVCAWLTEGVPRRWHGWGRVSKRKRRRGWGLRVNGGGGDFPGGPVVKNPPYNAGDAGSIPGQGTKIPNAAGQLSPHATTTELACPEACTPQLGREALTPQQRARAPQRWVPHASTKIPHAAAKTRSNQK